SHSRRAMGERQAGASAACAERHTAREKRPRRWKRAERGEPARAREAQRRGVWSKQAHQTVREPDGAVAVEPASPRIGAQAPRIAWIDRRVRSERPRQFPGVAQAEIEALTRDRMQRLRRIADAHHAPARDVTRNSERQRVTGAPAHGGERAETVAERM